MKNSLKLLLSVAVAFVVVSRLAFAYPGCAFLAYPNPTLAEEVADADVVALVSLVNQAADQTSRHVEFQIKRIAKGDGSLKVGQHKTISRFKTGKLGDLYIMFGLQNEKTKQFAWGLRTTSELAFDFAIASPSPKLAAEKRLTYYIPHLGHADEFIAKDALAEFSAAEIADYRKISSKLSRKKLLQLALHEKSRRSLYGVLLGFCGDEKTAEALRSKILEDDPTFRIGMDGMMSGYLMLTGEKGLDLLEQRKFKKDVSFHETYCLLQAIRFMWRHGEDKISIARLRQSVRILLDYPDLADLVIVDLIRMEDWSCLDRIVKLYDRKDFNNNATQRAIIRYLLITSREVEFKIKDEKRLTVEISKQAKIHLDSIRERDPAQVKKTLRFFKLLN
jgi:hypothetical protein